MKLTIITTAERAKFLAEPNEKILDQIEVTEIRNLENSHGIEMREVDFEIPNHWSLQKIAMQFLGAGIQYGIEQAFDIKFSSYGTEPERVR